MARRFDAPIVLAHPWIAQARQGPGSRDPRHILQAIAAQNGLADMSSSVYEGPLQEWLRLGEEPARIAYTNLFTALAVGQKAGELAATYLWIARGTDDALVVDDYSLITFSALVSLRDLSSLADRTSRVRRERQGFPELAEDIEVWLGQESPLIRNSRAQVKSVLDHGTLDAPCLHLGRHDRSGKRGRKATVPTRVATWGTYVLSWMTGNETLAVRLWNRLFLPREFRWVPEAYNSKAGLDYAVKKYSDAKRRMANDVTDYVNPMTFQGIPPVAPPPPLDRDTSSLVLWVFETRLRRNVNDMLFGAARRSQASPLEAMVLPSAQGAEGLS